MSQHVARSGGATVLLTGAFGSVGEWLLQELIGLGFAVTCLDLRTAVNERKAKRLAKRHRFELAWCDLTDEGAVRSAVARSRPDAVVHAAALIPPMTIKRPDLGRKVNVEGTRALVTAAAAAGTVHRFVLVSSYSVCGPCNPLRDPKPWTGDTPVNPQDDYGRQKVEAETILRSSVLPWTIVRLCAVFPLSESGVDPDTLRFSFELPYDRREHAIDVRDAAFAIARAAAVPDALHRTITVGGGEGWHGLGGDLTNAMVAATGLRPLPREAFRLPHPDEDAAWFYENWVDTSESQRLLGYQRHAFADFLRERRRRMGLLRWVLPLIAGPISRSLLLKSPYHGKSQQPDRRSFAEAARAALVRAD